ncbi:MAG: TRAP transporter fused permease subunit [Bacteroidetes bacterium]|jgi:TRAP transporter 4TM/12TM fusion protein|nr:TRAP transporter fused permease subunit [Tateyamaria sp.]MBT6366086.1 TRAP transporter fused permease subunit [Bacteroidota bacterium]|tara:strand:- start:606 stop:2456 length:1851 start_codon:yes stop_codon:yes gene_type:complete
MFNKLTNNVINVIAFCIGMFHLLNVSGILILSTRDIRAFHLLMMMALLFLTKPTLYKLKDSILDRIISYAFIALSVGSCAFILSRWKDIAMSGGDTDSMDAIVGVVLILLVLEAARRGVGMVLAIICLFFFTYPFYSEYLPGVLGSRGYSISRISELLTTTSQGVFGIPLGVSSTYIVLFSIYGAFLSEFGAGEFFFKLANKLTKGMQAAGAKTAVIFSTLLGMISGSAAGNVAVTGTLTIPMMKKEGYAPHQAGAIEAVVSTGGQIMPPVMGAAAFIMAEIVGVPYSDVMRAALIPALLFFTSLFFVVHLQAGKSKLAPLDQPIEDTDATWMILLKGGQYIIPFLTLIAMMLNGYSPFKASFVSIIVLLVAHIIWTRSINLNILYKAARAITEGSKAVVPIAIACAAAGIIVGTLGVTGLGSKISGLIITASGGITFFALLFTMLTAIILGMGLPTTAAYLILATVVAPALAKMGVPLLTAHLFVFFYGCVSTITPPVALASYVAAGIAKADINKVGWTAFTYGITCYILPFMFFYGSGLLMTGSVYEILTATGTGAVGVFCIAACVIGFIRGRLTILSRITIGIAGVSLLHQGLITDAIGAAIFAAIWFMNKKR